MFFNYDVRFVNGAIVVQDVLMSLKNVCCGASVFFFGCVRVSSIDLCSIHAVRYIVFEPLAVSVIREIFYTVFKLYGRFVFLQIVQSRGLVQIGDPSIFIRVCTPHRENAFKICRFILESVKKSVPIWKVEYYRRSKCWLLSSHKNF